MKRFWTNKFSVDEKFMLTNKIKFRDTMDQWLWSIFFLSFFWLIITLRGWWKLGILSEKSSRTQYMHDFAYNFGSFSDLLRFIPVFPLKTSWIGSGYWNCIDDTRKLDQIVIRREVTPWDWKISHKCLLHRVWSF